MRIAIIKPKGTLVGPVPTDIEDMLSAHTQEFQGMSKELFEIDIEDAISGRIQPDFFFVYKASEAISLINAGIDNYVFFINEFNNADVDSHYLLNCKNAILNSFFSVCRSIDWLLVFKDQKLRNKLLHVCWGYTFNSSLMSVERKEVKPSEINLLCLGQNNKNGQDFLNYELANEFAAKFGLSITFLNYGCEYFANTEYQFFTKNSNCRIECSSPHLFKCPEFLSQHDLILDLRSTNLDSLSSYYLNAMSTGMPAISTIAKTFGDRDGAIYHCNANLASITSAFQKVIENWDSSVKISKEFAVRRNWFEICKVIMSFIKKSKDA